MILKKQEYLGVTDNDILVCAHLRAGDYGIGINTNFYVLYYDYYCNCLKKIFEKNNKNIVLILCCHSADIKLALFYKRKIEKYFESNVHKLTIHFEADIDHILNNNNTYTDNKFNEIDHIYFMSYFDHYIMSNSSYSYWSSYLSNANTNVYCPNIYTLVSLQSGKFSAIFKDHSKFTVINVTKMLMPNYINMLLKFNDDKEWRDNMMDIIAQRKDRASRDPYLYNNNIELYSNDTDEDDDMQKIYLVDDIDKIKHGNGVLYSRLIETHNKLLNDKKKFTTESQYNFNNIDEIYRIADEYLYNNTWIFKPADIQNGGYYDKYIKYQNKYIHLLQ